MGRGLSPPSCRSCPAHIKKPRLETGAFDRIHPGQKKRAPTTFFVETARHYTIKAIRHAILYAQINSFNIFRPLAVTMPSGGPILEFFQRVTTYPPQRAGRWSQRQVTDIGRPSRAFPVRRRSQNGDILFPYPNNNIYIWLPNCKDTVHCALFP